MRSHYWSCTKFADWLRGTPKPNAETGPGWVDWRREAKTAHPVRYWLAEEALDGVQRAIYFIPDRLYDVKYYINNRFVSRTHGLTAHPRDIRPGTWCDVGNRFLPCLFNELVDFVEVELAWKNVAFDREAREKFKPPFWAWGWFRWRTWRSPEAGLDHIAWEKALVYDETWGIEPGAEQYGQPTHQSQRAAEVEELYRWWTEVYPNRPDPHDVSGWSEICSRAREKDGEILSILNHENRTEEEEAEVRRALDLSQEIEEQYEAEDEEMLIRLIKIRKHLWT